MENIIDQTIKTIGNVMKKHEESPKKDDEFYNIFEVLGLGTNETKICLFLADLLNPYGKHKRGEKYLKSFLEEVLRWDGINTIDVKKIQVFTEYKIENGRRIDIVLEYGHWFLPIEVKIEAEDSMSQCFDYYQYAKKRNPHAKVVYLTKRGVLPMEYSLSSENGKERIPKEDVICISFSKDIKKWLEKNLETETGKFKFMVEQYLETIYNFTNVLDEELTMEISNKILETEETFRTGLKIAEKINDVKAKFISEIMKDIEKQMDEIVHKYNLQKEIRRNWLSYEDSFILNAYTHSKNNWSRPGINYIVKDIHISDNIQMWFRIEADWTSICAGYFLFDLKNEDALVEELDEETKEKTENCMIENKEISEKWYYLPTGECYEEEVGESEIPNFYTMNEAAICLVNEEKRAKFIQQSINTIDAILKNLLGK